MGARKNPKLCQNAANPEYWPEDVTFISRAARAGAIEIEKAINIHRSVHDFLS